MRKTKIILVVISITTIISIAFKTLDVENEHLLKIAEEYKTYNTIKKSNFIVTDSSKYKWTVALCVRLSDSIMGFHYKYDSLFISKTDSIKSLHGDKLYKLYVKDIESYYNAHDKQQPIGQVLVKETYNIEKVNKDKVAKNEFVIQSKKDLKWYKPTRISELFIMYKEKESPANDKGWVYGIIDAEDKEKNPVILSNGKISSCIGCHKETKYDRVFGQ